MWTDGSTVSQLKEAGYPAAVSHHQSRRDSSDGRPLAETASGFEKTRSIPYLLPSVAAGLVTVLPVEAIASYSTLYTKSMALVGMAWVWLRAVGNKGGVLAAGASDVDQVGGRGTSKGR